MVKGYIAFLIMVISSSSSGVDLQDIPIVRDYVDLFPMKLPSMLLKYEVKFGIDLEVGIKPIFKVLY